MFTDAQTNGRTNRRTPDRPVYNKLTLGELKINETKSSEQ